MTKPKINQETCTVCGKCVEICPVDVFTKEDKVEIINPDACIGCRACEAQCPVKAIEMED